MPFAVELILDEPQSGLVRRIWSELYQRGITHMVDCGARPHITLVIWEKVDTKEYMQAMTTGVGYLKDLSFTFNSIGSFQSTRTIYAAPVVTEELVNIHRALHEEFAEIGINPSEHYPPGNWVPHCTLATECEDELWSTAFDVCHREWTGFTAEVRSVALIEFGEGPATIIHGLDV